jgi:DNA processing protein
MTPAAGALDDDTRAHLALHLVPGLGPRLTQALLERFGSAAAVLRATPQQLREVPHIGAKTAADLAAAFRAADVEREAALLERHGVTLLRRGAADYPPALATIPDPPPLLYLRGSVREADRRAVAIVGSRSCTSYGERLAARLAAGLVRAGLTVVSGLARGIDRVAHQAALEAGGRTIAVLAGGLARIYPPEHAELAEHVAAHGALLSEAPMAVQPLPQMFPQRNRIISGLSRGVVVVEAAARSGALITARHAGEQGRDVFAVPGPVDSPASDGTHRLLRDGAVLVRDVDDILQAWEDLRPAAGDGARGARPGARPQAPPGPPPLPPDLTPAQRAVVEQLSGPPVHADEIVQRTGLSAAEAAQALTLLELRGLARRLPGNRFERR